MTLLFDAYLRNRHVAPLPQIFFLHGNVRIGSCIIHQKWGEKGGKCLICDKYFSNVPLLYPVERKNYSENEYIKVSWESAKERFSYAFTITIFGCGAPTTDIDAVELLRIARFQKSPRKYEHIEIVDTADKSIVYERWKAFTPTGHSSFVSNLNESRLLKWPRRSCEALFYPMIKGEVCETFPLLLTNSLMELHKSITEISHYENCIASKYD